MTLIQEDALYDFLEVIVEAFEVDDLASFLKEIDPTRSNRLAEEIDTFINMRKLAFRTDSGSLISRRTFFSPLSFVISPTKLELLNGILIPGHRCVPFANSNLLPNEYTFFWDDYAIPFTSSEGPPEDFYPYYGIYGEEFAPQYVARDNSENEEAFFSDPYEDPPEVSIRTLDMRNIYRETSFVPGDKFVVSTLDWKAGDFKLVKVDKEEWHKKELDDWFEAAEEAFEKSFLYLGPGSCTEDQIAYAYWYGSKRLRELPSYSLEEYIYEKSYRVEIVPYGIETRFWYAGREIPDRNELASDFLRPDTNPLEKIFLDLNIPISKFVVLAYIRDSLFREGGDPKTIKERLVPSILNMDRRSSKLLLDYIKTALDDFRDFYSPFIDKRTGPIRSRAVELHTAVINLAAHLKKRDIDTTWLPRHTFIILSQIQMHTAGLFDDLSGGETSPPEELDALDSSLDSMVETYEDIKELIDEAMNNYRRNNFALIKPGLNTGIVVERLLQLSIGGLDVWRRLIVPENYSLSKLHDIIQTVFGWHNTKPFRFYTEKASALNGRQREEAGQEKTLFPYLHVVKAEANEDLGFDLNILLSEISETSKSGLLYEYGTQWNVRISILSRHESLSPKPVRCVAGAGIAPPEFISGPIKFKRIISSLEYGNDQERSSARQELGINFNLEDFNVDTCNRVLKKFFPPLSLSLDQKDG